jgi:hypothetical protein
MTTEIHNADALIEASLARIHEIEKELWAAEPDEAILHEYHAAFQQIEQLIAAKGKDQRHEFIIVIPVADRPQHLQNCLDSLLQLCKTFGYGGFADNRFQKVSAIIADDSKEPDNINKHKAIAIECNKQGLTTLYFGLEEQLDQLDLMSVEEHKALCRVIGNINSDAFYHKGPSIMRNIAYLELNKIQSTDNKSLYYFIDSDQEFQLKISTQRGDKNLYACNYLFNLDKIFSTTNTSILTGKVVGDPPVSPSVMAANFIEDVSCFLRQMAECNPAHPCQFHGAIQRDTHEASYHDMASLFGFKPSVESFQYHCTLEGEHDNAHCFNYFSDKLSSFFYGEHPTRKTYYRHEELLASIRPARTIYTGNYIFKPEALKYFIPFAPLKLRMAGPVLGRLIKAEIENNFVSANLPMLHKRTVRETGKSEFRPGISSDVAAIDLSGEFERQFYGDVMLFSIEKLTDIGYPKQALNEELVASIVEATHASMLQQYNDKRVTIQNKLDALRVMFSDHKNWWQQFSEYAASVNNFQVFMDNIEHNFGEQALGYDLINSSTNKSKRHAEIIESINGYVNDRAQWETILAKYKC